MRADGRRRARAAALSAALLLCGPGARAGDAQPRTFDLGAGSGVASIAARDDGAGFAVGFQGCGVVLLDPAARPSRRWEAAGCKVLFTVHVGRIDGREAVVASSYLGQAVVFEAEGATAHRAQLAATTDAIFARRGLVVSSDDGSVRLLPHDPGAAPEVLASGTGVARVLLPRPDPSSGSPSFFVAFDTGEVRAVGEGLDRRYATGVGRINGLALSADRAALFVAGFDGRVRAVDLAAGTSRDVLVTGREVNAVALDRTGGHLAAVNDAGRLIVVDLASGRTQDDRVLGQGRPVTAVAFGPDGGSVLAGDAAGLLHVVPLPPVREGAAHDAR